MIQILILLKVVDFFIVIIALHVHSSAQTLSIPTSALGDLTDSCYALGGDDPTHCSSATNMNHANPLRTHHTLDTALSPESSILSGVSQPVSVREREMHHQSSSPVVAAVSSGEMYSSSPVVAAVSSGEMYSIYDDPQYNTPEQRVPECELIKQHNLQ